MGMIRKSLSLSTFGLIDWRSDKERAARSARLTKRAAKRQAKYGKQFVELQRQQQR